VGDVFSEARASSLVKGFENSAPAWPAKRSPAATSMSSVVSIILLSMILPVLRFLVLFVVNPEKKS
jgi:nitric oxide reductase large subunit